MDEAISELELSRISRAEFEERLARTRAAAADRGLAGLLVVGRSFYDRPGNLAYLTNHFPPFPTMADLGGWQGMGHGFLVLPAAGDPILVVDGRAYREDLVAVQDVRLDNNLPRAVASVVSEKELGTIGLVGDDILPLSMYRSLMDRLPDVEWALASDIVEEQRAIKSPAEQHMLRRAADVAAVGLRAALDTISYGVRENEVNAAGTAAAMAAGADFVRYLRVHSGPWSAWGSRWPQASEREMAKGDLVALDIIGAVKGYGFDVLRTTIVGSDTLPEQREMCEAVVRALSAVLGHARAGVTVGDMVRAGLGVMEQAGYGEHMARFMGHGIGLETVEAPLLVPDSDVELQPGMVLCVEPGIFIRGWAGCSIEEEVIITDGDPEVIVGLSRRLWA
ncbi:MAG: Aminopeptidase YpdF [Anaerolineales bacterium]|nr:Aminopeptidase YpdF [Anaerolineales bacterium]